MQIDLECETITAQENEIEWSKNEVEKKGKLKLLD